MIFKKYKKAYYSAMDLAYLNKVEAVNYAEAIERVFKLHSSQDGLVCDHCETGSVFGYDFVDYPCPTIKAITGVQ